MSSAEVPDASAAGRPLVGISLKMYFGIARTRDWLRLLRAVADGRDPTTPSTDLFVLPTFPALESTANLLRGSGIFWGAQDLASSSDGAQTGEVSAGALRELGCRYVEVGHAERRRLFGENDVVVAAKTGQAFANGLIPVLCVGESDRTDADTAARVCIDQLEAALTVGHDQELVVAYEPVWAIGVAEPAPAGHVRDVCDALRAQLATRAGHTRLLYGGSAGPGTFTQLAPCVDGLFLGRFAHDIGNVRKVIDEIQAAHPRSRSTYARP